MDADLLVNPKIATGVANLETIDIPTITFEDAPALSEPPAPKLVPSFDEAGPIKMEDWTTSTQTLTLRLRLLNQYVCQTMPY